MKNSVPKHMMSLNAKWKNYVAESHVYQNEHLKKLKEVFLLKEKDLKRICKDPKVDIRGNKNRVIITIEL